MSDFVVYRGVQMSADWPEKIRAAQKETTLVIGGQILKRIPYGRDWPRGSRRECHDCAVISGELHVPGCDMERCPSCRQQLITCLCDVEGREEGACGHEHEPID